MPSRAFDRPGSLTLGSGAMRWRGMFGAVVMVILATGAISSATASARVVMGCSRFSDGQELLTAVKAAPRDCSRDNSTLPSTRRASILSPRPRMLRSFREKVIPM